MCDHEINGKDTFVSKIYTSETEYVYLLVIWQNTPSDIFDVKIFHEEHCWAGKFHHAQAVENSRRLNESENHYLEDLINCLKKQDSSYRYDFTKKSNGSAIFSWKKMFEGSTAVILHGSVEVQPDSSDKDSLINKLMLKVEALDSALQIEKQKLNLAEDSKKKLESLVKSLNETKESLENIYFPKIVQLLNSKKRRIHQLEDLLDEQTY